MVLLSANLESFSFSCKRFFVRRFGWFLGFDISLGFAVFRWILPMILCKCYSQQNTLLHYIYYPNVSHNRILYYTRDMWQLTPDTRHLTDFFFICATICTRQEINFLLSAGFKFLQCLFIKSFSIFLSYFFVICHSLSLKLLSGIWWMCVREIWLKIICGWKF